MHPIETRGLTVVYRSGIFAAAHTALDRLDLTVDAGEVFGFIGPNGAGKTTTIKTLLGLIRPTRGTSTLFGVDSREAVSRREIGFLPEAPYFYEYLTARETVAFYARLSGMDSAKIPARAGEVLERVGLTSAADRPVRTYSRGMRQRLGLAQAIVHGPKLAILDEPMSGLDPLGRRDVRLLILELAAGGVTVFFSSHILSDIEALCDRVGVVSSGTLVAHGSVQELASPRVTAVEIRCTGISTAAIEGLSPARVRDDAGLLTFEVRDEQTADRAARLVIEKGGVLKSLQPVRESLEDVFSRLQVAGTGVAGPEPKGGAQ